METDRTLAPRLADCLATPHVEEGMELGWGSLGVPVIETDRLGRKQQIPISTIVEQLVRVQLIGHL